MMSEFGAELRSRIQRAESALRAALEADDEYGADVRAGELESLRRLADEHGIDIGGPAADDRPDSGTLAR
jgi:hypothetical protein